ncbi:hybrid sensor histidine kinase/response regulator transcription factor [Sinomicrobium soli]|uniref:hybrid sensor histidine kinase/response regulator transcription factor n=1 Tax=Sinomicrobium sp. N-1-3-6 TaxID=2219864 RepID=UPI000DCF3CBC|nr:hybrid sensor histidine kinase/response regulator transcription factor [Sinomicrobium sp. N-1-3-6]RAV28108.1 hypothetical protein DN748_15525 [Sinomicrobium sp. N-1-3-6]
MLDSFLKYCFLFLTGTLCCSFQSTGQEGMLFSRITSEHGLDSDESRFVFQDSDGFIWIGTDGGLFRHDGYEMVSFETIVPDSKKILGKAQYFEITESDDKKLWVASSAGIFYYDKKKACIRLIEQGDQVYVSTNPGDRMTIEYDPSGKIWFGGSRGIFFYDLHTQKITHYNSIKNRDNPRGLRDVLISSSGDVWLATWKDGLGRYIPETGKFEVFEEFTSGPSRTKDNVLNSLYQDRKGRLWVGTWDGGLYVVDISEPGSPEVLEWFGESTAEADGLPSNIIYDINEDLHGSIWVGTPFGLSIISTAEDREFNFLDFGNATGTKWRNHEISSILKDRSGLMWLATFGGGVSKIDLRKNKFPLYHISPPDNRKSQSVYAFIKDHKGRLLLGVQSLGFGVYDLDNKVLTTYEHIDDYSSLYALDLNTVRNFTRDKKGNLWLGTRFKGLIKYSPSRRNYIQVSDRRDHGRIFKEVFRTVPDLNNKIWALTNKGFYTIEQGGRFIDNTVKPFEPRISGDSSVIQNTFSDFNLSKNGYLYLATNSGDIWKSATSIYSDSTGTCFFKKIPRPGNNNKSLNTLFIDGKNRLWVGTNNGLEIYTEEGKPAGSDVLSGIKNLSLHAFEEDEKGNIIATSNKGLIYINMLSDETRISLYTIRNGLQANYFIKGSIFKDEDGTLFAGGHQGFNHLNPLNIKDDHMQPALVLTNLRTSRKNYYSDHTFHTGNPFRVDYDDNMITLSFSSIDMRDPDNLNYAYKLEGLENEWKYVTSNNRTATYVNLKPGKYTFRLKATNANGQWTETSLSLPVFVETAPYFSWWAYSLYALAVTGIIVAIFVLYRRKVKIREALKVENIERIKSEKLHQFKLQFFTNLSHELLTPLSVLTILSDKGLSRNDDRQEKEKILKRNVKILNDRIKQMLHFRKAETDNMALDVSWQNISGIIGDLKKDYEILAEEKGISFKINVPGDLTGYIDPEKIKICVNNLLSNAFKYTPEQGAVTLEMYATGHNGNQHLTIVVADTGKGIPREDLERIFDRYYRLKSVQGREDGLGIGLALTNHLVEIQQGTIDVESEAETGTRFKITVPIGRDITGSKDRKLSGALITEKNIEFPEQHKVSDELEDVEYSGKAILLVEDNEDYLKLMQSYLRNYYKVFSCLDGKSALDLANSEEIDLIVSDLRIPDMNGHELCRAIKGNVNTSHIPVVVVTAHAGDEERKKGYEAGVDTYFSKPINLDVLVYRIESLLKKREKIYSKFNKGQFLEPEKIVSTSIDEEFLARAKRSVEHHISDSDFSVKMLCRDLGMSNSMFYRKIKGLLDITPNEFIKNIRLRRAAQLLTDNNIHISEVAYMIGFNDLSYFSACFKKQYGVSPSTYQKKKHDEQQVVFSIPKSTPENDIWEKFNDN